MRAILFSTTVLLLMVSCIGTNSTQDNNDRSSFIKLNGEFVVVQLDGGKVQEGNLTLNIDQGQGTVTGSTGCNDFFSQFKQQNKAISIDKVGATKKFCQDPGVRQQEKTILRILQEIVNVDSKKDSQYNFYDDQSKLLLVIVPKT